MMESLVRILGTPVRVEELKHKPGRRRTIRARGPLGSAIVKLYASERAPTVARRLQALSVGPFEPCVPALLHLDRELRLVVLSEVFGRPLRESLLAGDLAACQRVGSVLGGWHSAWLGGAPEGLAPHRAERELAILRQRAESTHPGIAEAVLDALPARLPEWDCRTVVHRDLYEEQVLIGERVGLIDLDDAALGPPELDVGNLVAHIELLGLRRGLDLRTATEALLSGYRRTGPALEAGLLSCCRVLTLLRLACLHQETRLLSLALGAPDRP